MLLTHDMSQSGGYHYFLGFSARQLQRSLDISRARILTGEGPYLRRDLWRGGLLLNLGARTRLESGIADPARHQSGLFDQGREAVQRWSHGGSVGSADPLPAIKITTEAHVCGQHVVSDHDADV